MSDAQGPAPAQPGGRAAVAAEATDRADVIAEGATPAVAGRDDAELAATRAVDGQADAERAADDAERATDTEAIYPVGGWQVGADESAQPVPVLPLTSQPEPAGRFSWRRTTTGGDTEWKWVEEWREGNEPTPWGPGLALAAFAALLVGTAVFVIGYGLRDQPALAIAANVVVAVGLAPALWMSRQLPVLRWVALGSGIGTVVAWIAAIFVIAG